MGDRALYGAVEAGGTKFVCAAGYGPCEIPREYRAVIATTTPAATLAGVVEFFERVGRVAGPFAGIGVGAFGPLDIDRCSATWGCILKTPKLGWSGVSLRTPLERFNCPITVDTDVNAAALAEARLGAATDVDSLVYVTVGTGIGGGVVLHGRTVGGMLHPEMGHIRIRRHAQDGNFSGLCPFHGECLEGLASGPAVLARWGGRLDSFPDGHPALAIIGDYLGQLAATVALMLSPQRSVFGGGVMSGRLLPLIRAAAERELGGYLPVTERGGGFERLIVSAGLADQAGIMGAMLLAGA